MSTQGGKKVLRSRSRSRSASPVRTVVPKPKPAKTQNQLIRIEKRKHYHETVDELQKEHKYILRLHKRYAKAKAGHELVFTKNGEERTLTMEELERAEAELNKKFQTLKKLYNEGSKNTRAPLAPSSFKATYTPCKVSPVFIAFFGPDKKKRLPNLGEQPNSDGTAFIPKTSLLELLPRVKEGYLMKNSLTLLINIYNAVNDLKSKVEREGQKNIPDERMNHVFGELDALYYQAADEPKILMTKSGKKLSTYAVVSGKNSRFNPSKIENYYFQSILSLNVYEHKDLSEKDIEKLSDANVRQDILQEYLIIEKASELLQQKKKSA